MKTVVRSDARLLDGMRIKPDRPVVGLPASHLYRQIQEVVDLTRRSVLPQLLQTRPINQSRPLGVGNLIREPLPMDLEEAPVNRLAVPASQHLLWERLGIEWMPKDNATRAAAAITTTLEDPMVLGGIAPDPDPTSGTPRYHYLLTVWGVLNV